MVKANEQREDATMLPYILIILTGLTDLVIALVGDRRHWRFWRRTFVVIVVVDVVIGVVFWMTHV